jgi:hypothetical protein
MGFKAEQHKKDKEKLTSLLRKATKEKDEAIRMVARERSKAKNLQDRLRQVKYLRSHGDQAKQVLRHQLQEAEDAVSYFPGQMTRLSNQSYHQNLDFSRATRQVENLTRQRDYAHTTGVTQE